MFDVELICGVDIQNPDISNFIKYLPLLDTLDVCTESDASVWSLIAGIFWLSRYPASEYMFDMRYRAIACIQGVMHSQIILRYAVCWIPSALQTSGFFIGKAPRCPPCVPSNCITVTLLTLGTGARVTCWRMVTTTGVTNTRGGSQQGDIRELESID